MSKIKNAFDNKKAFIAFFTAGDPSFEKTVEYVLTAVDAGADLIELGIPFSDPIADGPVIQAANLRAFKDNTTVKRVFEMVECIRKKADVPIVFLTYLNPVFNYGYDAFFKKCEITGVDGIIVPDLPFEEKTQVEEFSSKYNVDIISLIAPTSEKRIKTIAKNASGFIYVVSSMGVTGVRSEITTDLRGIVNAIKSVTDTPAAIGFGISRPDQAKEYSSFADGVIVGSAIVRIVEKYGTDAAPYIYEYVKQMKDAVKTSDNT